MITYQSVFGWISTVITALCFVWLIGLGIFVVVRLIVQKIKQKKEMKNDLEHFNKIEKDVCEVDVKERKEDVGQA